MFPEIHIPLEIIGWHVHHSTNIEAICSNFAAEILSFGKVNDPTKDRKQIEENVTPTVTSTEASPIINNDVLQTLYDVFTSIPRDHIQNTYIRLKDTKNPNWYDDIVNELLSYDMTKSSINKRSLDEMYIEDKFVPDQYSRLLAILPDIDPDYALESYMKYTEAASDKTDLNTFITSLIEHGYVKHTDKLECLRNQRLKENLRNPRFEMEEFLKTFPDPLAYFYDRTKNVSESYKYHAYVYLANAFARISSDYIKYVLSNNNYRFAPAMKQLQEEFHTYHVNQKKSSGGNSREQYSFSLILSFSYS